MLKLRAGYGMTRRLSLYLQRHEGLAVSAEKTEDGGSLQCVDVWGGDHTDSYRAPIHHFLP